MWKYGSAPDHICNDTTLENEIHNCPDDTNFRDNFHQSIKRFRIMSSQRKKGVDWKQYDKSYQLKQAFNLTSIVRGSIPWEDGDEKDSLLSRVVKWNNFEIIERNFNAIRDLRYFKDESVSDFQRRISWLYPDDGCWTRLSAIMKDFFGPHENPVNSVASPSKIYVYGNLCTLTDNHPEGSAQWWYHAAPIVQDEELKHYYVLDPSVNGEAPIQVDEWVEKITSEVQACSYNKLTELKFNICNGYGINPYDYCERVFFEDFGKEISAELIQRYYRRFERSQQTEMGRNPNVVLGDQPPWNSHQRH